MDGKKLTLSRNNRQIMGVCGGIGEYLGVDPTVIRVIWVAASIFTAFAGVILYLALCFIIPQE